MAKKKKYTFDGLTRAMSYKMFLEEEVNKQCLRGAKVVVKEYKARIPKPMQVVYEMDNKTMKRLESILVTLQSGGKIIAHTLLTNEFWYGTIKKTDREGTDDMKLSAYANFLTPLGAAIDARV